MTPKESENHGFDDETIVIVSQKEEMDEKKREEEDALYVEEPSKRSIDRF